MDTSWKAFQPSLSGCVDLTYAGVLAEEERSDFEEYGKTDVDVQCTYHTHLKPVRCIILNSSMFYNPVVCTRNNSQFKHASPIAIPPL